MDSKRVSEIIKNKELSEVYYNDRPVWIQELQDNIAKVGFIDSSEEKNVFVEDLYEKDLFN